MSAVVFKPNDLLVIDRHVWVVTGDFAGAMASESLVGLANVSHGDGSAYGQLIPEMFVPNPILQCIVAADPKCHTRPVTGEA